MLQQMWFYVAANAPVFVCWNLMCYICCQKSESTSLLLKCAAPIYKCNTHISVHCNALEHTATHCNTPIHHCLSRVSTECFLKEHSNSWCTATHCIALHHTASHCNTLQHTATHFNTLQHTATHWCVGTIL